MVQKSLSPGWARRRQERLREIFDAALRVMDRDGLESFTLPALAKETGYAVAFVYHYFPSKEALLVELQREVLAELQAELTAALGRAGEDPLKRIWVAVDWYRALPRANRLRFRLLSTAIGDPRELASAEDAARVLEAARPLLKTMAQLLDDAVAKRALEPGHAMRRAIVLWASLQGVLQLDKLSRADKTLGDQQLASELVGALLRGWGAKAPARKKTRKPKK